MATATTTIATRCTTATTTTTTVAVILILHLSILLFVFVSNHSLDANVFHQHLFARFPGRRNHCRRESAPQSYPRHALSNRAPAAKHQNPLWIFPIHAPGRSQARVRRVRRKRYRARLFMRQPFWFSHQLFPVDEDVLRHRPVPKIRRRYRSKHLVPNLKLSSISSSSSQFHDFAAKVFP